MASSALSTADRGDTHQQQTVAPVWVIISQDCDKHDPVFHSYSDNFQQAKENLERIAVESLKSVLGVASTAHFNSPLYDTIRIEDISQGITIRYRTDVEEGKPPKINDRIIDMVKIEKSNKFYIVPTKTKTIIKTFKIIKTDPAASANLHNTIPVYLPTLPVMPLTQSGNTNMTVCPTMSTLSPPGKTSRGGNKYASVTFARPRTQLHSTDDNSPDTTD